jgi:hypothetical protein
MPAALQNGGVRSDNGSSRPCPGVDPDPDRGTAAAVERYLAEV